MNRLVGDSIPVVRSAQAIALPPAKVLALQYASVMLED